MSGYQTANGLRFADVEDVKLPALEGATVTTDGYSRVVEVGDRAIARLTLTVGAHSASDVLDVDIETSRDGVNNFYVSGSFTQTSEAGVQRKVFLCDRFIRARYNVTGAGVSIPANVEGELA